MSVGVPALDTDHKTLISLLNLLARSIGDPEERATLGSVLQALVDYADHHFAREEALMEACRYPQYGSHALVHRELARQVAEFKGRYDQDPSSVRARECLDFLHRWLIDHICTKDMDYRPWLIGQSAAMAAAEKVGMTAPRGGGASLDWRAVKVLVVDDNVNFCQVLRTILEGVGVVDIAVAHDLSHARTVLEAARFDVVITDWHVGADSGIELVAWIRGGRADVAGVPVLVLSGHERLANREVALGAGADEFMEKPISARGLLICLARLIAGRRSDA